MNEIFVYCVCVCALIPKKMSTQQCHAIIITLQCVRCAALWFCFRFSFIHTYIVFSNHDTFFSPVLSLLQYSWHFLLLFFILVQPHRHNNFPPDGVLTWLLPRRFLNAHLTASDLLRIEKIKPHRKIDFVATQNNNNNNADRLFPYASVCENDVWFASNSPRSCLMIYNWFAKSMEKYQMVYEPHEPCELSLFDDFMAFCSFLLATNLIRTTQNLFINK